MARKYELELQEKKIIVSQLSEVNLRFEKANLKKRQLKEELVRRLDIDQKND